MLGLTWRALRDGVAAPATIGLIIGAILGAALYLNGSPAPW